MKHHGGTYYTVKATNGYSGLCTTPDSEKSIESSRILIDETNARAVQRGYKVKQYGIFLVNWHRWYNGDALVMSEENESLVETYPAEL